MCWAVPGDLVLFIWRKYLQQLGHRLLSSLFGLSAEVPNRGWCSSPAPAHHEGMLVSVGSHAPAKL